MGLIYYAGINYHHELLVKVHFASDLIDSHIHLLRQTHETHIYMGLHFLGLFKYPKHLLSSSPLPRDQFPSQTLLISFRVTELINQVFSFCPYLHDPLSISRQRGY